MSPLTSPHERMLVALSRWRVQLGFCFAVPTLLFAHATPVSYLSFLPVVLLGVAIRTWARGHLDRAERVCMGGPYGWVRHPLYVGSFLVGLGVTLMALPWVFIPLYVAIFAAMYVPKAMREEVHLARQFGTAYATYAAEVPAVLPRFGHVASIGILSHFEWRRVWRHREWRTWVGVASVLVYVWLRMAPWS